jgi:hypothetical protein
MWRRVRACMNMVYPPAVRRRSSSEEEEEAI